MHATRIHHSLPPFQYLVPIYVRAHEGLSCYHNERSGSKSYFDNYTSRNSNMKRALDKLLPKWQDPDYLQIGYEGIFSGIESFRLR